MARSIAFLIMSVMALPSMQAARKSAPEAEGGSSTAHVQVDASGGSGITDNKVQPRKLKVTIDANLQKINARIQGYGLSLLTNEYGLRGWSGVKILRALQDSYSEKKGPEVVREIEAEEKAKKSLSAVAATVLDKIFPDKCTGRDCLGEETCSCWKPSNGRAVANPTIPSQFAGPRSQWKGVGIVLAGFLAQIEDRLPGGPAPRTNVTPQPVTTRKKVASQPARPATRVASPTRTRVTPKEKEPVTTRKKVASQPATKPKMTSRPAPRVTSPTRTRVTPKEKTNMDDFMVSNPSSSLNQALQDCKKELEPKREFDQEFKVAMCCGRKCNRISACASACKKGWKNKEY